MTSLQTTHTDLARALTGLISRPLKPAKRSASPIAALAMKLAWEKYNRNASCHTQRYGFNRRLFASYLESAWYLARCYPNGPVEITLNECLHIAGKE